MSAAELKNKIAKTYFLAQQQLNSASSKSISLNSFKHDITGSDVSSLSFVENGFLPLSQTLFSKKGLRGQVPYWKLSSVTENTSVQKYSLASFGQLAFFTAHLWDKPALNALQTEFGPPDGFLNQEIFVNLRTVGITAEGLEPMTVKFPTYDSLKTNSLPWVLQKKIFQANREMSALLSDDKLFLNEQEGLLFEKPDFSLYQLIRPLPFEHMALDGHDLYLPLFALYSRQLLSTPLEAHVFGLSEKIDWFRENIGRQLIEIIFKSFFKYGVHFELHQQNISALIRNSSLSSLFIQDFFDVMEDPLAQVLLRAFPEDKLADRNRAPFGYCNEWGFSSEQNGPQRPASISSWYRLYLRDFGQHEKCINENFQNTDSAFSLNSVFSSMISTELKSFSIRHDLDFSLSDFYEYDIVCDVDHDFYARLTALRELIVFCLLRKSKGSQPPVPQKALLQFFKAAKDGHGILQSYGHDLPEEFDALNEDWQSYIFSPHPKLTVLFQINKNTSRRARYFGLLSPRQSSDFYTEYFKIRRHPR